MFRDVFVEISAGVGWIWVDVACIDQNDRKVQKRDENVGTQAGILARASKAFIWLHQSPTQKLQDSADELFGLRPMWRWWRIYLAYRSRRRKSSIWGGLCSKLYDGRGVAEKISWEFVNFGRLVLVLISVDTSRVTSSTRRNDSNTRRPAALQKMLPWVWSG